jgi:hypothetical protein
MRGSSSLDIEQLRVIEASRIESAHGPRWLIEDLWESEGVGILGGAPKSCKTWLAMDLAFSVATSSAALGRYEVGEPGPVLIFCAEDQPAMVRTRLEGLASHRKRQLDGVPLYVVVENALRLDTEKDQTRLSRAISQYRPRLLVLDPFVRLHRIDENSALEVSGILAYLREVQRRFHVAILVVHHSRKAGVGAEQAGLSLRGSGDFHAWGESNLYLRRRRGALELQVEQRNAPTPEPVQLTLRVDGTSPPHLEVVCQAARSGEVDELKKQVVEVLFEKGAPRTQDSLRSQLHVRIQRLQSALRELESESAIERTPAGWILVQPGHGSP